MADQAEHLVRLRRADSDAKATRVVAALNAMVEAGETLAVAALARRARVSRRFIYDHPELRAELTRRTDEAARRWGSSVAADAKVSVASLRADLANAKARNHRLEADLNALARRLGQMIGAEAMADIAGTDAEAQAAMTAKLAETEQELIDTREALARCTEELDAARHINRELTARLNRPPS